MVCLAGAAPATRQSGNVEVVTFRWAVDKHLRGAVIDFAGDSHHDHPHAVRILARAWLHIIWRCWHDNAPYHPENHRALQRVLHTAA